MSLLTYAAALGSRSPVKPWPPPPREGYSPDTATPTTSQPSGPRASCWTIDKYDLTDSPLPMVRDRRILRGNVMGVRVPGKLWVPGEPAPPNEVMQPEFMVTWFVYEQTPDQQQNSLDFYRNVCGYYTIDFHLAAWLGYLDGIPGCSEAEALRQVSQAREFDIDVMVNLAVNNGEPDRDFITYWIDRLVDAGMNLGCPAWQIDQRIGDPHTGGSPLILCDYLAWVVPYLRSKGVDVVMTHWVNHGCAVYDPETCAKYGVCDRRSFQRFCASVGLTHVGEQFDINAEMLDVRPGKGGILGEVGDMLESFDGTDLNLVIAESDMQAEFNRPYDRIELYGDMKQRGLLTPSWTAPSGKIYRPTGGYLNGNRQPSGLVT